VHERPIWYHSVMVKTLELALAKVAALPEAAQEQIGRELMERIDALTSLRDELKIGLAELEQGEGAELDIEEFIGQLRREEGNA
jgi:hypothetical protein